jgi:ankyrin repeat protein
MCRVLLGMGADPNKPANDQTPLIIASQRNNKQIVELLIEYKADARVVNSQRLSAMDFAILYGNYTIALYFVR